MFTQILIAIPIFLIAITLLVAVHEFGHFWVARTLGVKVLRFSIGFGKPIWRKTPKKGETEYVISALPLGGYVKMLDGRFMDESAGEGIDVADLPRAYNRQPVWKRLLILFAGPAANFLFAIAVFYFLFIFGVQEYKPFITPVDQSGPAALAGIEAGDEVVAVNNKAVQSFEDLIIGLVDGVISSEQLNLNVKRDNDTQHIRLNVPAELATLEDPSRLLLGLGIQGWRPNYYPEIVRVDDASAAKEAGLAGGDQIKRIGSIEQTSVQGFITQIQGRPNENIQLVIVRQGEELLIRLRVAEKLINNGKIGIIGASLREPESIVEQIRVRRRFGLLRSFNKACASTYAMSALSLKMFREMIFGQVSIKNLSGPISIAQQASYSAQSGLDQFIKFLALISIALGIVNLLPIPMLDGGQIVFNVMELVKGSPVSERTELIFQQMGIVCIFLIMGLAIYNDFERLLF